MSKLNVRIALDMIRNDAYLGCLQDKKAKTEKEIQLRIQQLKQQAIEYFKDNTQ